MTTIILLIIIWLLIGVITYQEFLKDSLVTFILDVTKHKEVSGFYVLETLKLAKGNVTLLLIFLCLGILPGVYILTCKIFKIK